MTMTQQERPSNRISPGRLVRQTVRLIGGALLVIVLPACAGRSPSTAPVEGLDPSGLPREVQADYAVFAQRCSKCHSLARPLNSGITDENYWSMYVERMRRQPGSGISPKDATEILRFLYYYAQQQIRDKQRPSAPPAPASPSPAPEPEPAPASAPPAETGT